MLKYICLHNNGTEMSPCDILINQNLFGLSGAFDITESSPSATL